jgi:hypothetical protein
MTSLKEIFGMVDITRNEELRHSYSSSNIISAIKSMRWAVHVARIGMRNEYKIVELTYRT